MKPIDYSAYARAKHIMSTESVNDFEWSVKIVGTANFHAGIASQFQRKKSDICSYDRNAIIYSNSQSVIKTGESNKIHSNLTKHESGDVICFRFLPHIKKLVIYLVRK